jgi:hypothetical protein
MIKSIVLMTTAVLGGTISMKVLILSTTFYGLTQRLLAELQLLGHTIEQHYDLEPKLLQQQV